MSEWPRDNFRQKTIHCLFWEALSCGHRDIFSLALKMKSINIRSQANRVCFEDQSGHWFNSLSFLSRSCQTLHLKCFMDGAGGNKGLPETEPGVYFSSVGWILNRSWAGHWRNLCICWHIIPWNTRDFWGSVLATSEVAFCLKLIVINISMEVMI